MSYTNPKHIQNTNTNPSKSTSTIKSNQQDITHKQIQIKQIIEYKRDFISNKPRNTIKQSRNPKPTPFKQTSHVNDNPNNQYPDANKQSQPKPPAQINYTHTNYHQSLKQSNKSNKINATIARQSQSIKQVIKPKPNKYQQQQLTKSIPRT